MSPRPKIHRKVGFHPILRGFKPLGIPFRSDEYICMLYEEFESLRLADYENLSQEEAAVKMNISRPTFTRIYDTMRKKIAQSFIEGKTIIIDGGDVQFDKEWYRCSECHHVFHSKKAPKKCTECGSADLENINENISKWQNSKAKIESTYKGVDKYCLCIDCYYKKTENASERPCMNGQCIPLIKPEE